MELSIKPQLREIFKKSEEVFGAQDSSGTLDLVPFCESILALQRNRPTEEDEFEEAFIEDFDIYKECTWELAQVCMYHLKLPKFKAHLESRLKEALEQNNWRAISVIRHILNAYEEPWVDKVMFYDEKS